MILKFIYIRKVPRKAQVSPSISISNGFLKMFMNGKALYIPLFKVSIMPFVLIMLSVLTASSHFPHQ